MTLFGDMLWKKEIVVLEKNSTWTLEFLPLGRLSDANGYTKLNTILMVQLNGIRLNFWFFVINMWLAFIIILVAKMVTIRVFLSIDVDKNWELHQMDIHSAFLHGYFGWRSLYATSTWIWNFGSRESVSSSQILIWTMRSSKKMICQTRCCYKDIWFCSIMCRLFFIFFYKEGFFITCFCLCRRYNNCKRGF